MLLGFLELQQKWGRVEEGEVCWSFFWRNPDFLKCDPGSFRHCIAFPYTGGEEKLIDLGGCVCSLPRGFCVTGCELAGHQKASGWRCGGGCAVTVRCRQ